MWAGIDNLPESGYCIAMEKNCLKMSKVWILFLALALSLCLPALAAEAAVTTITCGEEIAIQGSGAVTDGQTIEISKPGHYILSGKLIGGRVVVKARGGEVSLELADFYGENSEREVIDLRQAASVRLLLREGTHNVLLAGRLEELGAAAGSGAALEADCPLTLEGEGALAVYGCLNNGLSVAGDLTMNGGDIQIQAAHEGIKAQNLSLAGAEVTLSALNDGLELAGSLEVSNGSLEIRAARDGIDAMGDVVLSGGSVTVYTDEFAFPAETLEGLSAATEASETAEEISFKVRKTIYNESDQYWALFSNGDGASVWVEVPFEKTGSQNMYFTLEAPAGFSQFVVYRYTQAQEPRSTELYDACTDTLSLSDKEIYSVSSVKDGRMTGAWSTQNSGMGGWMSWGNPYKRDYSCKGIKSLGNFVLSGGELAVGAWDDAIHAGGTVTVEGGLATLYAIDDGLHSDGEMFINGGQVDILGAYEGIEGYNIYMNGGKVTADCWDDGTNAGIYFVMNGGELDLTLPQGDTDGLDANYALWMTGGFICVRSDAMGGMAGTIDTGWGGATVKGGSLVSVGATAEIPHSGEGNVNYVYFYKDFPAGDYALLNAAGEELLHYSTAQNYYGSFISSEHLELGEEYQITLNGETYLRWTQEKAQQTVRNR